MKKFVACIAVFLFMSQMAVIAGPQQGKHLSYADGTYIGITKTGRY